MGPGWIHEQGSPADKPKARERFAHANGFLVFDGSTGLSNGSQTSAGYRSVYTALTDCADPRCLYGHGAFAPTGQYMGDDAAAADLTLKVSLETANNLGEMLQGLGAGGSFTVPPGGWVWTPPAGHSLAGSSSFAIRDFVQVASGKKWYYTRAQIGGDGGSDAVMHSAGAVSAGADITGNIWTSSGYNAGAGGSQHCPLAIVATQTKPKVVVGSRGDSILNGFGPADGQSWVQKALAGSHAAHAYRACIGGSAVYNVDLYDEMGPTLAPFADYWVIQWQNDPFIGIALSDIKAAILSQVRSFSLGGARRVIVATSLPRTTSSDNWQTAANQAIVTGETTRIALNDWLRDVSASGAKAQSGGLIWMIVDACAPVETNAAGALTKNGGRWIVNGSANYATVDGIHPTNAGRDLIAACLPVSALELF